MYGFGPFSAIIYIRCPQCCIIAQDGCILNGSSGTDRTLCREPLVGAIMRENQRKWIRGAGLASTVGLVLVVSTVIGYAFGSWLDKKLGTDPWLMLVFTLMGIAAGFIEMFRIVLRLSKED